MSSTMQSEPKNVKYDNSMKSVVGNLDFYKPAKFYIEKITEVEIGLLKSMGQLI